MKAIVYLGDGKYELQEIPTPTPGPGEVLVRVDANTICGTDLRIVAGAKKKGVYPPVVLGHELAGTVVEVGPGFDRLQVDDRVGMTPSITCGWCDSCQRGWFNLCANVLVLGHSVHGGLAEYFLAPAQAMNNGGLVRASSDLLPEEIALTEPLSCVLHAHRLLGTGLGETVVVIGGGPIGQLHAQLARSLGARQVIMSEPVESRRDLALKLGTNIVVDPIREDLVSMVAEATGGLGADVVIVCTGVPDLVAPAVEVARPRGRISLFAGFPAGMMAGIDPNAIHYRELIVTGSSNSTAEEYTMALDLIAQRQIDVLSLVSHRFCLDNFAEAVATAADLNTMKVAVKPSS
ncbi:MAG: alcohol dehydrogenase catalytic domain-containing protein [Propionibacteriaceae bacterium]|jgi:L-iditol 2-dehydrogenase|nr:alcohol dehydrogenase catalytic domain-containing protein [Propionibacteriaceae bacterium]